MEREKLLGYDLRRYYEPCLSSWKSQYIHELPETDNIVSVNIQSGT